MNTFFLNIALAAVLVILSVAAGCGPQPAVTPPPPAVATEVKPAPDVRPTSTVASPTKPAPATAATPKPSTPRPAAPFYEGKTIQLIAASAAGGATDIAARAVATFLPKHLPGNPKIVVRNVPGGGGTIAINSFVEKVKPDGMTLLASGSGTINSQRIGLEVVAYDLRKVRFVASFSRVEPLLLIRKDAVPRLTDPRAKPAVVGAREASESWQAMTMWGKEFLGWNIRWILGFASSPELILALRRGEIDIWGIMDRNQIQPLVDDGVVDIIAQIGIIQKGKFVPRPDYPDVPVMADLLLAKGVKGIPWEAYAGWLGPGMITDRWLAAPPGTPDNIMSILIKAYGDMASDPQFDAWVKKTITPIYTVTLGDEVDAYVKEILSGSRESVEYAFQLQRKFGIAR